MARQKKLLPLALHVANLKARIVAFRRELLTYAKRRKRVINALAQARIGRIQDKADRAARAVDRAVAAALAQTDGSKAVIVRRAAKAARVGPKPRTAQTQAPRSVQRCSVCGAASHNRRSCPKAPGKST